MKTLYVLYDGECALCCRFRGWILKQPAYLRLEFVPLQSATLPVCFPGITAYDPKKELLVVSDEGAVYQGSAAWIMVLYALHEYREWAMRMADPRLLPLAQRAILALSNNRLTLSRWFTNKETEEVIAELPEWECKEEQCQRII